MTNEPTENAAGGHERSSREDDHDDFPTKGTYQTQFDVEEMIMKLRGPEKVQEKARLMDLKGEAAVDVLDSLQAWLDINLNHEHRRIVLKRLVDIASASNELPRSLFLDGVELPSLHPAGYGAYADVFRGTYRGSAVALKRLRIKGKEETWKRISKQFCREGLTWRQLSHPNILPFLGIDAKEFMESKTLTMVSPWMEHGTLMEYICSTAYNPYMHRSRLIYEVAQGLHYVHSQGLVHGDLHGSNIFVSADGCPYLADFGLAVINDITLSLTMTGDGALGAMRWLAPELILAEDNAPITKTPESDVFSFGRVCLAICTRQRPFHETPEPAVIMRIIERKNPPRPVESNGNEFCVPDELWNLMMECWAYTSVSRPKMSWVVVSLAQQRGSYSSGNSHFHRAPVDGEINNHNLLCDNCKEVILGVRYQCASCISSPTSYNLCEKCEPRSYIVHNPMHIFFKLPRPVHRPLRSQRPFVPSLYKQPAGVAYGNSNHEDPKSTLIHSNVACDLCVEYIQGAWYWCVYCGKDLCHAHEEMDEHDKKHFFVVFKGPIDMLAFHRFTKAENESGHPRVIPYFVYLA